MEILMNMIENHLNILRLNILIATRSNFSTGTNTERLLRPENSRLDGVKASFTSCKESRKANDLLLSRSRTSF